MASWWLHSWPHRVEINWRVPRFLKAAPDPFRGEVLEVGAGQGWTSRRILETFPQVELTATDINPDASAEFSHLEQTYGERLHIQAANVLDLPFDRESFDFVIAINVLPLLPPEEARQAIRQLLRVLRPGGLIGIQRCGLFMPARSAKEHLRGVLAEEGCDILVHQGGAAYYFWVRKSYPVEGGVVV
jgi:SAM-dependent methyltransferase